MNPTCFIVLWGLDSQGRFLVDNEADTYRRSSTVNTFRYVLRVLFRQHGIDVRQLVLNDLKKLMHTMKREVTLFRGDASSRRKV